MIPQSVWNAFFIGVLMCQSVVILVLIIEVIHGTRNKERDLGKSDGTLDPANVRGENAES